MKRLNTGNSLLRVSILVTGNILQGMSEPQLKTLWLVAKTNSSPRGEQSKQVLDISSVFNQLCYTFKIQLKYNSETGNTMVNCKQRGRTALPPGKEADGDSCN